MGRQAARVALEMGDSHRRAWMPLVTALLAITLVGCGSDSEKERPASRLDPLLMKLPTEGSFGNEIVAMDLDEARRQLGLPQDADPTRLSFKQLGRGRGRFLYVAQAPLAGLLNPAPAIRNSPVAQTIDIGAIGAVAATVVHGPEEVTAIDTDQPFELIARRLERLGLTREGAVLVDEDPARVFPSFSVVADAGDGIVVLATTREAALAALDRDELSPAAQVVRTVEGVIRRGVSLSSDDESCVRSFGLGQDLVPPEGEVLVRVDGEADAADFTVPPLRDDVERVVRFGAPVADGDEVSLPVTYTPGGIVDQVLISTGPIGLLYDTPRDKFYDCG